MLFDKYRKTFQMYKDNTEKVKNANLNQTDINKKTRIMNAKSKLSGRVNTIFDKRRNLKK